jgi:hypothetical protein
MDITYGNFVIKDIDEDWLHRKCLFVCVSGSHSFGWVTSKSDLDARFIVMTDIGSLISPFNKSKTRQSIQENIDITYYPIEQFISLLAKGNGNAIDNLFEPKLWQFPQAVTSLKHIVSNNIHKGFIHHCLGYSTHILKDINNETRLERYGLEKLLLCRYRAVLQGLNLLNGNINYNLPELLGTYPTKWANGILTCYIAGGTIDRGMMGLALLETNDIHHYVYETMIKSNIPDTNDSPLITKLDEWIKEQYLGRLYYENNM